VNAFLPCRRRAWRRKPPGAPLGGATRYSIARVLEQVDGAAVNQAVNSRPASEAIAVVEKESWQLVNISVALSPDLRDPAKSFMRSEVA
jgi:hypothetical protein